MKPGLKIEPKNPNPPTLGYSPEIVNRRIGELRQEEAVVAAPLDAGFSGSSASIGSSLSQIPADRGISPNPPVSPSSSGVSLFSASPVPATERRSPSLYPRNITSRRSSGAELIPPMVLGAAAAQTPVELFKQKFGSGGFSDNTIGRILKLPALQSLIVIGGNNVGNVAREEYRFAPQQAVLCGYMTFAKKLDEEGQFETITFAWPVYEGFESRHSGFAAVLKAAEKDPQLAGRIIGSGELILRSDESGKVFDVLTASPHSGSFFEIIPENLSKLGLQSPFGPYISPKIWEQVFSYPNKQSGPAIVTLTSGEVVSLADGLFAYQQVVNNQEGNLANSSAVCGYQFGNAAEIEQIDLSGFSDDDQAEMLRALMQVAPELVDKALLFPVRDLEV